MLLFWVILVLQITEISVDIWICETYQLNRLCEWDFWSISVHFIYMFDSYRLYVLYIYL